MAKEWKQLDPSEYALYCPPEEGRTQQHLAQECDINEIVARASKGHEITHLNTRAAVFGDFRNIPSYEDALKIVNKAEEAFMSLPWQVRERFSNDPQKLLNFVQDPSNAEELVKMGLALPKESVDVPPADASAGKGAKPDQGPVSKAAQ